MRGLLVKLLRCPGCLGTLELTPFVESPGRDEVLEGLLECRCGLSYPIVNGIPRMLENAFDLWPSFRDRYGAGLGRSRTVEAAEKPRDGFGRVIEKTRESFGYQWTLFSEMVTDFRENFLYYIEPLDASFFPGKVGIDVGCGFGRHIYNAATLGAEMVGVDISTAIDAARRNTQHLPNVHLVQANLYRLPFRQGGFDFAYSIGVLHHLPDPEAGFRCLPSLVKPGGPVFIWVYSKSRPVVNFTLECARTVTTRLPKGAQQVISFVSAALDWTGFIVPYQVTSTLPFLGPLVRRVAFPRLKVYSRYPFQVVWADWFDRLTAPIRFYYDARDLDSWLSRAQLDRPRVTATGLFGWRAYGEQREDPQPDGP